MSRLHLSRPGIRRLLVAGVGLVFAACMAAPATQLYAQSRPAEGLALQVSPSPLVATIKPGVSTSLELRIRNTGSQRQLLKMGMQAFTIDETTGEINLQKDTPAEAKDFVRFENPSFSVEAGEIVTQKLIIDTPATAGFTYSFATTVSQQNPPAAEQGSANLRGTVAVFTLLSVDKPGAVRRLELSQFMSSKRMFEYVPAEFSVKLKNTGNTLVQPKGTVYIQRDATDDKPLASLQLNQNGGYILPGASRQLPIVWDDGFPRYEKQTDSNGKTSQQLSWSAADPLKLRMGRYVAKIVAVYDDGRRDVPLTAEVTFWVIPWRMLVITLAVILLIVVGIVTTLRKSGKALGLKKVRSGFRSRKASQDRDQPDA